MANSSKSSAFGRGCYRSKKKFVESCLIEGDSFKLIFSNFSVDFVCIKDSSFLKCIALAMAFYSGLASFQSVIEPTPFIVLVGDE